MKGMVIPIVEIKSICQHFYVIVHYQVLKQPKKPCNI